MVPVPRLAGRRLRFATSSTARQVHVLYLAFSTGLRYVVQKFSRPAIHGVGDGKVIGGQGPGAHDTLEGRSHEVEPGDTKFIVFVVLIPILVLLSGLFAGLTLGYMSLDETQLNVLSVSGTPEQREYASKIKPIRKNGHLLLVTLLLANMIVNETLPVIADRVLGGGLESVVVSTVLIVIFSEIIPQSLFSRHGLYLGAKMAGLTTFLIYALGIISWPVAKFLDFALGSHHGIIYRRAELKELIALHSSHATLGGDLKTDTVTIIGAALDLQEKVVVQAMTPIDDAFMVSIDSKLDCALLRKICETGHSRVPVYEEIEIPVSPDSEESPESVGDDSRTRQVPVKKILGILLVKNCVMLDPKDATPIRDMSLNEVPFVPNNEPLLGMLDRFQEGRSHMAIVSRFSEVKATSVKKVVKQGLTQRLHRRVRSMGDSGSSSSSDTSDDGNDAIGASTRTRSQLHKKKKRFRFRSRGRSTDMAHGDMINMQDLSDIRTESSTVVVVEGSRKQKKVKEGAVKTVMVKVPLEQSMPADAVLAMEAADEFLQSFDPAVMPLGIITLEDVLEELIGEEIYDEFDAQGAHGDPYQVFTDLAAKNDDPGPETAQTEDNVDISLRPAFVRSSSAPPIRRGMQIDTLDGGLNANDVQDEAGNEEFGVLNQSPKDRSGVVSKALRSRRRTVAGSAPTTRVPSPAGSTTDFGTALLQPISGTAALAAIL